jgi:hypothetical protein
VGTITEKVVKKRTPLVAQRNTYIEEKTAEAKKNEVPKGGYILFFLVLGVALIEDLLDGAFILLQLVGTGLSATAVGAPLGMPIAFLAAFGEKLVGLFATMTLLFYFGFIGGRLSLRLAIMSVGFIMEMVPFLSLLPFTTFTFVSAFMFGRISKKVQGKIVGKMIPNKT